jgi:hypothetical protein
MKEHLEQLEGFPKLVGAATLSPQGDLLASNARCCFPTPVMAYLGQGLHKLFLKLEDRRLPASHGCVELGKLILFYAQGKEFHLLALFQNNLSEEERSDFLKAAREILPGFGSQQPVGL